MRYNSGGGGGDNGGGRTSKSGYGIVGSQISGQPSKVWFADEDGNSFLCFIAI